MTKKNDRKFILEPHEQKTIDLRQIVLAIAKAYEKGSKKVDG